MYFQFLIEDKSMGVLVNHIMEKLKFQHGTEDIVWNIKTFKGIGNIGKSGSVLERKTGKLLNDLPQYMKGFDRALQDVDAATIVVVLDNDKREPVQFRKELEKIAYSNMILTDHVFCIAIKELEAWLLGDHEAIIKAYPNARMQCLKKYEQDGICETWEVLADMVYPKGLSGLKKKAGGSYTEIGAAKCEWADNIGKHMNLYQNASPSYRFFISELEIRVNKQH